MNEQHQREEVIFDAAFQLPREQRAAYLIEACAGDQRLLQRVLSLLKSHEKTSGVLEGAIENKTFLLSVPPSEKPGDRIGRYKLLQQIGEGGCGVVYMAEQEEPVRRRVALKIIKLGMDTKQVIARFEAERQALAMMDHPNIAKVLDAGATETGRPFFVMELVRGAKITEYCDQHNSSTRQRLDTFVQVCHAIQHAHQKGIVHRDIKPSNILVTLHDGEPRPMVIDFGIAKATGGLRLTDQTVFTAFEQFLGTPAYMSPEQAQLTNQDIDTRSDIYSLGVLLYELLTGRTPFDQKELLAAGLDEMRRTIQEKEPPRPSTRLSTMAADALTTTANHRHTDVPRLIHLLRGDLDWIVMKALDKDRTRRYETANGLAMDIQRHLSNEPVVARPPSAGYRLQKAFRRNKLVFAAGASVVAALLIGLSVATWMFIKEKHARRQAVTAREQAETNFKTARDAIDRMFINVAEELTGLPRTEQVRRKLLEEALQYYQGFLKEKSEDSSVKQGAAVAYLRVGTIYEKLGDYDKCLEPLGRGIALLEELGTRQPLTVSNRVELAKAHATIAFADFRLNPDIEPVLAHTRKQLALWEELWREFPKVPDYLREVARSEVDLGNTLRDGNQLDEAFEHFRRALQFCEMEPAELRDSDEHQKLIAFIRNWLGALLEHSGRRDEAEPEYRAVIKLREQLLTKQPNDAWLKFELAHIKIYLAKLLMESGRLGEAEELLRAEIALHEQLLQDFPGTGEYRRHASWGLQTLGQVLAAQNRWEEAEADMRRSVALREKLVADFPNVPEHLDGLADFCYQLGVFLAAPGRSEQAAEAFRKSLGLWEKLVAPSPKTRSCERHLAWMLATCPDVGFRNPPRAVILARQSMLHEVIKPWHWSLLGIAQYRAGDPTAAIESLHESMEKANGGDAQEWLFLAMSYWEQGDRQQARQWYDKAAAWIEKVHPADESYGRFRAEAAGRMQLAK